MTTNPPNGVFAATIAIAFILSTSYVLNAHPRVVKDRAGAASQSQEPDIQTIKAAGLQFELPKGWKSETQENGNVFLTLEDGAANITFVIEDNYAGVMEGMKFGLKEKLTDIKSDSPTKEDTHNGMTHLSESGTGLMQGVKITWSIDVLKASKNITMLTFGVETVLQKHSDEYEKFLRSLKKI
jgi:hypothetical protein